MIQLTLRLPVRVDLGARKTDTNSVGWAIKGVWRGNEINAQFDWKGDRKATWLSRESAPRYQCNCHQILKGSKAHRRNCIHPSQRRSGAEGLSTHGRSCVAVLLKRGSTNGTADLQRLHLVFLQFNIRGFNLCQSTLVKAMSLLFGKNSTRETEDLAVRAFNSRNLVYPFIMRN